MAMPDSSCHAEGNPWGSGYVRESRGAEDTASALSQPYQWEVVSMGYSQIGLRLKLNKLALRVGSLNMVRVVAEKWRRPHTAIGKLDRF